jgi:hypothetical protein
VDKWRARNAVTNAVGNAVSNAAPVPVPVPVPVPDIKKEKEVSAPEVARAEVIPFEKPDPRKAIFDDGLRWLASATKRPESSLRPLVGKWIKARGDPDVASALVAAQRENPVDAISWIEARLQSDGQRKPTSADRGRDLANEFLETASDLQRRGSMREH